MADIKMCPRCCSRPRLIHTKNGYIWKHVCKSFDGEFKCESRLFDKFGDAVRDWNTRVKNIEYVRKAARIDEFGEVLK